MIKPESRRNVMAVLKLLYCFCVVRGVACCLQSSLHTVGYVRKDSSSCRMDYNKAITDHAAKQ
jgi:hypothetical protein